MKKKKTLGPVAALEKSHVLQRIFLLEEISIKMSRQMKDQDMMTKGGE
jgi:hypothetical protein